MSDSNTPTSDAATDVGTTRPAGEELSDAAAVAEVADQTASDRKAEDFFKRESNSAATDKPATETTADEIADPR
jgi:hypothetical protein